MENCFIRNCALTSEPHKIARSHPNCALDTETTHSHRKLRAHTRDCACRALRHTAPHRALLLTASCTVLCADHQPRRALTKPSFAPRRSAVSHRKRSASLPSAHNSVRSHPCAKLSTHRHLAKSANLFFQIPWTVKNQTNQLPENITIFGAARALSLARVLSHLL